MRYLIPIILIFISISITGAQEIVPLDTVRYFTDSLKTDTTRVRNDTTSVKGIDTMVVYSSTDSIVYSMKTKMMSLYSNSDIKYQKMQLQAERIDINWDSSIMNAFGVPDSSDTTGKGMKGKPVMKDGGETYDGKELAYNFKSKRGRITIADTKMDDGYYHGDRLKKVAPEVLFVADGRYTTCDRSDPDYYFFSPTMKVMVQDKIVAEPIYMYISNVPVFWFPVAVLPNKGGRRSGILTPSIAENGTYGRLLHNLGYYWAMNDYMGLALRTDLYTKGSWGLSSDFQYRYRDLLSGGISGDYRKLIQGESSDPGRTKSISYNVHINHSQEIDPTSHVNVNFTFASNNSYRNTIDLDQALNQQISSNATYSKSWEDNPNSITLNIQRQQNLITGNVNEVLPSFSFSHSNSYPLRSSKKKSTDAFRWYENIGLSYGLNFANNRAKVNRQIAGIAQTIDSVDTVTTVEAYEYDRNYNLNQHASLSIAPKLGYITISPSLSYSDERSYTDNSVPDSSEGRLVRYNERAWGRRGTISTGVSMSTKIYGIVQPEVLGVTAIRHTFTPNLSFNYSKQILGANAGPKQMMMSFNVGNNFEMKSKSSEAGKDDVKTQLMNIGAGISYNFSADSLRFSDLNVSYRTGIANVVDVNGGASFDLYKLVQTSSGSYRKVNKFLISEEGRLARMKNFSLSLSTHLSGDRKQSSSHSVSADSTIRQRSPRSTGIFYNRDEEPDFSIPWNISLSWNFYEYKEPGSRSRSSNVQGNLDFNLTENWKFSVSGGYDLINKQVAVPQIGITRDLHCWIMDFSWVPFGNYRSYRFEIRLKASQLEDIKITKSGSASGIY
jgi:hypothetical protein